MHNSAPCSGSKTGINTQSIVCLSEDFGSLIKESILNASIVLMARPIIWNQIWKNSFIHHKRLLSHSKKAHSVKMHLSHCRNYRQPSTVCQELWHCWHYASSGIAHIETMGEIFYVYCIYRFSESVHNVYWDNTYVVWKETVGWLGSSSSIFTKRFLITPLCSCHEHFHT